MTQFSVSFANSPPLVKALEKSLGLFMAQFGVAPKKYILMNSVLSGPQKFISMQRTSSKAFEMPFSVAKSFYVHIATNQELVSVASTSDANEHIIIFVLKKVAVK